jgi:DNA-binding transcriptional MerR regulator
MRIGAVARELGVSPEWLRDLERSGRLPAARRDLNGHRRYSRADVQRLRGLVFGKRHQRRDPAAPITAAQP